MAFLAASGLLLLLLPLLPSILLLPGLHSNSLSSVLLAASPLLFWPRTLLLRGALGGARPANDGGLQLGGARLRRRGRLRAERLDVPTAAPNHRAQELAQLAALSTSRIVQMCAVLLQSLTDFGEGHALGIHKPADLLRGLHVAHVPQAHEDNVNLLQGEESGIAPIQEELLLIVDVQLMVDLLHVALQPHGVCLPHAAGVLLVQLQQPLQLLKVILCELVEHPGNWRACAVATEGLDDGRHVLLHLAGRGPGLCFGALLHEHRKNHLQPELLDEDPTVGRAVPQRVVRQAERKVGGEDVLAHHPNHELQTLHLAERDLVRWQQHQGAEAVKHVLHKLGLLAVRGVPLSVGRDASQQLVHPLETYHALAARRGVLQDDPEDLGGVDAVVIDVAWRSHPLYQPGQELRDRTEQLAGIRRADFREVLNHCQAVGHCPRVVLAGVLVDPQEDVH
mmetsp:Transcript_26977/g.84750  ORF Transcript_26977/g.84750 Transcript_26977/m.84750 type:complete len:451 (-) Transcript_26977:550-1902(-)